MPNTPPAVLVTMPAVLKAAQGGCARNGQWASVPTLMFVNEPLAKLVLVIVPLAILAPVTPLAMVASPAPVTVGSPDRLWLTQAVPLYCTRKLPLVRLLMVTVVFCSLEIVLAATVPVTSPPMVVPPAPPAVQLPQVGALPVVAIRHWPLVPAAVDANAAAVTVNFAVGRKGGIAGAALPHT